MNTLDNYETIDIYQIKNMLDDASDLRYSRQCYTQYTEFYLSSEYCSDLGWILNQDIGSNPNDTETLYMFYRPNGSENDKVKQEITDMIEISGMKELKSSDHSLRIFKVKNLDDLDYIITMLEGIIEDFK